jgi:hypothetical protein
MTTPSTSTPSAGSSTETNTNPSNLTASNTLSPDSLRQLQKQVACYTTIMDSRRSTTLTKPLSLQLKSASSTVLKFEEGDGPNEKTPTSAKRAKTKK